MKNMVIGQYYPAQSVIHRLDPRVKLVATFAYIILLFAVNSLLGYGLVVLFLAGVIALSKVPPGFMFRGLKGIMFILIFTVVLNAFFTGGTHILWRFGFLTLTMEGVETAVKMGLRLVLLVTGSSVLTLTTSPIALTDGIEFLLKPFKKLGVPAHEIAMMMTIALRFIPTLMEEMDKIMKAQMARGADFDTGGLLKKAKSLIPLLVPLFVSAFRRADELAMAMEARCYRGDVNRTRMKALKLASLDYKAMVLLVLWGVLVMATRWL